MTKKELSNFLDHHPDDIKIMIRDSRDNTLRESYAYYQKIDTKAIIIISFDYTKLNF